MAGEKMTENGKYDYLSFFADVRAGRFHRCCLFEGEEEYTKDRALEQLIAAAVGDRFPEINVTTLRDPAPDELIACAETVPFMADRRVLVVRDYAMLLGKPRDYDEDTAFDRLDQYLPHAQEGVCIVFFVRGKADGKRRFKKMLQKKALCVDFVRPDDGYLTKWTARELKKYGRIITRETMSMLWFRCSRDMYTLEGEIRKLAAYTDGEEVTSLDVEAVCSQSSEARVFDLASALLSGDGLKAFRIRRELILGGESAAKLLALLAEECRRVRYCGEMARDGISTYEAASRLGMPEFAARAAVRVSRDYSPQSLAEMCRDCVETEYAVKSGSREENGALEALMLRILYRRGRDASGGRYAAT